MSCYLSVCCKWKHEALPTRAWLISLWWMEQVQAFNIHFSLLHSLRGGEEILLKCCGPRSWVGMCGEVAPAIDGPVGGRQRWQSPAYIKNM